ncbi:MAG: GTPase domain-containing protein [Deltaproteobacteria bacterium]|nr:GTPase domain-containing protein [Deltaproteobacteria bacterium]
MNTHSEVGRRGAYTAIHTDESLWERITCPGVTPHGQEIHTLARQLPVWLAVFRYRVSRPLLWIVFAGGTGTGKSTIFNALCGKTLSETGVERPKTSGPIAFVHRNAPIEEGFPFCAMAVRRISMESVPSQGQTGVMGEMTLIEHGDETLTHCILVDTPDVDSVELRNREAVDALYLLAHVVVFVASQEKYADEVPYQFLARVVADGKPCFLLLNKAADLPATDDVLSCLEAQGLVLDRRKFHAFRHVAPDPASALVETSSFKAFQGAFFRWVAKSEADRVMHDEDDRAARALHGGIRRLFDLLRMEEDAAGKWREHLDLFFHDACRTLLDAQQRHFTEGTRETLQKEIRRHFSKYDLLRTPRRIVSQIIRTPLELFGIIGSKAEESHRDDLLRLRQRIDLVPVKAALERFNREVLEKLSPQDESAPLYERLRDSRIVLTEEEIKDRIWEEQDRLAAWIEETFEKLAKGIPKSKEWGIYSASILWGGLILSLEAAIGGGITILEAVLDTAVAPFVTKGAVELFAYQELQKIARELGRRYQAGLLSTLRMQRDRYAACLDSLLTSTDTLQQLRCLEKKLSKATGAVQ